MISFLKYSSLSRRLHWVFVLSILGAFISYSIGELAFEVTTDPAGESKFIVFAEVPVLLLAVAFAALIDPGLVQWEGRFRRSVMVSLFAFACVLVGMMIVASGVYLRIFSLYGYTEFGPFVFVNAFLVGSLTLLLASLIGPYLGGTIVVIGFYVLSFLQGGFPAWREVIPIVDPRGMPSPWSPWILGCVICSLVGALIVYTATSGRRRGLRIVKDDL